MNTLYTVQRCRQNGDAYGYLNEGTYGPIHGADNDQHTVCGQDIDRRWFIVNNTFDGEITCKKCLKILGNKPSISQRFLNVSGCLIQTIQIYLLGLRQIQ